MSRKNDSWDEDDPDTRSLFTRLTEGGPCIRHLLFPYPSGRLLAVVRKVTAACHRGDGRRGHHFLSRVQMEKTS